MNSKKSHQITTFLDSNPEFLENYVMANVDLETLERWTIRRARRINQMEHLGGGNKHAQGYFREEPKT